jgi:hypothetical protein
LIVTRIRPAFALANWVIRRPDADAVAGHETQMEEAGCQPVGSFVELAIGPADVLMADDQRLALAPSCRGFFQHGSDRLVQQRLGADAAHIAQVRHCVTPLPGQ